MNRYAATRHTLISLFCGLFAVVLVLLSVIGERRQDATRAAASAALALSGPTVSAEAYIVRFAGEDQPLLERRAGKSVAPASLTKLMTAVVAAEHIAPGHTARISAYAAGVEERTLGAEEGEEFFRDDLLRATLVMSANDAALALAERAGEQYRGGTRERGGQAGEGIAHSTSGNVGSGAAFVRMMNARARVLGLDATHFENPTGLDMPRHAASAADLATLAEYILRRHPRLWDMTRDTDLRITSRGGKTHTVTNSNALLQEFPAILGGKTGRTDNAKEALLLLYPVAPEKIAVIVLLRSDDRFGDGRRIIRWLEANCLASRGDSGERPCEP